MDCGTSVPSERVRGASTREYYLIAEGKFLPDGSQGEAGRGRSLVGAVWLKSGNAKSYERPREGGRSAETRYREHSQRRAAGGFPSEPAFPKMRRIRRQGEIRCSSYAR